MMKHKIIIGQRRFVNMQLFVSFAESWGTFYVSNGQFLPSNLIRKNKSLPVILTAWIITIVSCLYLYVHTTWVVLQSYSLWIEKSSMSVYTWAMTFCHRAIVSEPFDFQFDGSVMHKIPPIHKLHQPIFYDNIQSSKIIRLDETIRNNDLLVKTNF